MPLSARRLKIEIVELDELSQQHPLSGGQGEDMEKVDERGCFRIISANDLNPCGGCYVRSSGAGSERPMIAL